MFASVGLRGGPRPPVALNIPEPDLSHLTEEERKIIMAVLARQREEEAKEEALLKEEKPIQARTVNLVGQKKPLQQNDVRGIQQQLSSYRETVIRQASVAASSAVHRDDAPTCGICHKTKFADGCGNLCSYCKTKFCARCGGRVSLRSNTEDKVSNRTTFQRGKTTIPLHPLPLPPMLLSGFLQHQLHSSTELQGMGVEPKLTGDTDRLLPHTPIRPEGTMRKQHLLLQDTSVAALALAVVREIWITGCHFTEIQAEESHSYAKTAVLAAPCCDHSAKQVVPGCWEHAV